MTLSLGMPDTASFMSSLQSGDNAQLKQTLQDLGIQGQQFSELFDSLAQGLQTGAEEESASEILANLLLQLSGQELPDPAMQGQAISAMLSQLQGMIDKGEFENISSISQLIDSLKQGKSDSRAILDRLQSVLYSGKETGSNEGIQMSGTKLPAEDAASDADQLLMSLKGNGKAAESPEGRLMQMGQVPIPGVASAAANADPNSVLSLQPLIPSSGSSSAPQVSVNQPVSMPPGQPGWDMQVGQRLMFMVNREMQSAEIRLNPAELGPMEVKVRNDGDRVSVVFQVLNAPVRDAIEQSIPRLREFFAEQGMNLVDVDVSQQGFSGREDGQEQVTGQSGRMADTANAEMPEEGEGAVTASSDSLIDYYI